MSLLPDEPALVPLADPAAISGAAAPATPDDLPDVGGRYVWLMVVASFGAFMAFITPIAYSLAVRLSQIAPGHDEYLGYVTGAGAAVVVLTGPLLGQASDRMRTRWGRRRPFIVGGTLLGFVALAVMAMAPSVVVLGIGWILAQLTWGQAFGNLQNSQADRLPEHQRGKVAGLTGFAQQIAPVFGVGMATVIVGQHLSTPTMNLLLFFVPGIIGGLLILAFAIFVPEADSRGLVFSERATVATLFRKMVFSPKQHPDYAWNWLGRFLFYVGLTFNTTFTAFFFAQRLGVSIEAVAGTITMLALLGILAVSAGAIGGGFMSDRLKRRKPFVLASGIVFGAGAVLMALSSSYVLLVVGSLLTSVGLGLFSAVDQALALDVLPDRTHDAGRYMAIMGFSVSIPQALAPLLASSIIVVGAAAGAKNYTLLYLIAAGFTTLGGLVILRIRSVR